MAVQRDAELLRADTPRQFDPFGNACREFALFEGDRANGAVARGEEHVRACRDGPFHRTSIRRDELVERVVPEFTDLGWTRRLGLGKVLVTALPLVVEHPPGDEVVHQLENPGDVISIDV